MSLIAQSISAIGLTQNPMAVSSVGYLTKQKNEGRSGYWRLFYTQLQEDALKKTEIKSEVAKPFKEPYVLKESDDGSVAVITEVKKPKKKAVKVEVVEEEVVEPLIPPFKRVTPTYQAPVQNFLADAWRITLQIQTIVTQYNVIAVQFDKITSTEDDDVEALLLLM